MRDAGNQSSVYHAHAYHNPLFNSSSTLTFDLTWGAFGAALLLKLFVNKIPPPVELIKIV